MNGSPALQERITVRMTSEMITRIDAWIAEQPGYVSRQGAVRHCVDLVLGQRHPDQRIAGASQETAHGTAASKADD